MKIINYLSFCGWFISLRICPQDPSMLEHVWQFPSFLRLNDIPSYYTPFCLCIHPQVNIWLLPPFDYWKQCCYECGCTNMSLRTDSFSLITCTYLFFKNFFFHGKFQTCEKVERMVQCTSEYLSLSFNSYQLVACHYVSPTSLPTIPTLDYFEANPTHHIISSVNISECISKKNKASFQR